MGIWLVFYVENISGQVDTPYVIDLLIYSLSLWHLKIYILSNFVQSFQIQTQWCAY